MTERDAFDRLDEVVAQLNALNLKDPETRRVARLIEDGFDALADALLLILDKLETMLKEARAK